MERDEAAFTAGAEAAKTDITAGRRVYRWSGHSGHWGHWIVNELEERFGVGVNEGFGVCFVTSAQQSFDEGYNEVLIGEIERQYGDGAFKAVICESRNQTEESLWSAKESWTRRHPED